MSRITSPIRDSRASTSSPAPMIPEHEPSSGASQIPRRNFNATLLTSSRSSTPGNSLDLMGHLQRSGPSIVKTRTGSVLSRGFILKTDFYPSGAS